MSPIQKLLEMRERDNDICGNLRELRGAKYAKAVSAFANLFSMTELVIEVVPMLSEPIRAVIADTHLTMAEVLDVDFETFMTDVVMVAKSRITEVASVIQSQGGHRG